MTNNLSFISTVNAPAPASQEKQAPNKKGSVDALLLAYFCLVDAATTSSESAEIRAKEMQGNAKAQQILNQEQANLHFNSIPAVQRTYHTTKVHVTNVYWTQGGGFFETQHTYTKRIAHTINNAQIMNAQAANTRIAAERQGLSDQMTVLQQGAQISATGINTVEDEAMQSIQEGSNLMQILESLTFKALLRSPPQT